MNKLILIFYIGIGNLEDNVIDDYMNSLYRSFPVEDDIIKYFIPYNGETKIECLNPKLVTDDEYLKAKEVLDNNQKIVEDFIKNKLK